MGAELIECHQRIDSFTLLSSCVKDNLPTFRQSSDHVYTNVRPSHNNVS